MDQSIKENIVRDRAYQLWVKDGRPREAQVAYWLLAEQQHAAEAMEARLEEGLHESFPASDTPSVLLRAGLAV